MEPRRRVGAVVSFAFGLVFQGGTGFSAPPQVPSLPLQSAGYVKYAITDLPLHYKNGPVAATNNARADNPLTDAGATLGRVLFYDKRLSHNDGVACASCHRQANGFSDPNQFSQGFNGELTGRHSMGLSNATYYQNGRAFWDERAASLEEQALLPIQSSVEMGMNLNDLVTKLSQTKFYPTLFQAAFGSPDVTTERIGKAIAQFERAMVSYKSKYDTAFTAGQPQPNFASVFNAQELAGEALFHGTARCGACHTTNAHVGDEAHNIGLDAAVVDAGAGNGEFKTPSLRNVAVRGRFMHDGRFASLEEVIQFYSTGVQNSANLDPLLRTPLRLNLTTQQIGQLVAYLNTLTDTSFLTSTLFTDPFATLPGDYDGDGEVSDEDYFVWRANFGDTTRLSADGNFDGVVDTADYSLWRHNYGRTWQTLAAASAMQVAPTALPEPTAIALAALTSAYAATLRGRRSTVRTSGFR